MQRESEGACRSVKDGLRPPKETEMGAPQGVSDDVVKGCKCRKNEVRGTGA